MTPQPESARTGSTFGAAEHMNLARLFVADELAERWQVPRAHVYRLAREGLLPTVRLGRYMRWRLDAVEKFEQTGGAANG